MIRRNLRKIIPMYATFPLLLTGINLVMSFGFTKLLQVIFNFSFYDLTLPVDAYFAFNPGWVIVYVETFLFWLFAYIVIARESPGRACFLAAADGVSKVICLLFFILLPSTNVRPVLEGNDFFTICMRIIHFLDTPTNLFPSMHCFIAWTSTRLLFRCKNLKHKNIIAISAFLFTLLIFLSTLYTKQHVVLDVFGGVAVSEIGLLTARYTKLPKLLEKLNARFMESKLSKIF